MPRDVRHRDWGALSGFGALITGAAGGALERGWPSGHDTVAVAGFISEHHDAIVGQSLLFLISFGFYLRFLGCLRAFLARAEGGQNELANVAFGAGIAWIILGMVAQAFQIGQTLGAAAGVQPAMMWTMAATFAIANLPCGVMLAAVAAVSLRHGAFPPWLGVISVAASLAEFLLAGSVMATSGPLAPNGWMTYVLYPMVVVWLVPTTVIMLQQERWTR